MKTQTIQIYIKATSNYPAGMPLQTFQTLSPIWTGDKIHLPFGESDKKKTVVGWTDLFNGRPCPVSVAKVQAGDAIGYLVWGGNSGLRVLDPTAPITQGLDDHLPPGYGKPIIWVEDIQDFPAKVTKTLTEI